MDVLSSIFLGGGPIFVAVLLLMNNTAKTSVGKDLAKIRPQLLSSHTKRKKNTERVVKYKTMPSLSSKQSRLIIQFLPIFHMVVILEMLSKCTNNTTTCPSYRPNLSPTDCQLSALITMSLITQYTEWRRLLFQRRSLTYLMARM